MSEAAAIEAPVKPEETGLDRLSKDPNFIWDDIKPEEKTEPVKTDPPENTGEPAEPTPEDKLKAEAVELGLAETATQAEIDAAKAVKDEGFKEEGFKEEPQDEGDWKGLIQDLGYTLPEDFTEEKGGEILKQLKAAEIQAARDEVKAFTVADLIAELPEKTQAEARLVLDLLKTGQTLEEINAPVVQIRELKSLSPEALIRRNLEGIEGWTPEMIDHEMQKLKDNGHIEIEHKKLMLYLDGQEKQIKTQQQQQLNDFANSQNQLREQKRTQEFESIKREVDKKPSFMDRKLTDDNRKSVINDFANGGFEKLMQNPADKVEFMLYKKFGKQGLEYLQARALEKAVLDKKKEEHNIPVDTGGGARTNQNTTHATGLDRLSADPNFKA